jgi:sugar O-acyltransferase (sialic acid O-acetyltransferase NeuD family)
MLIAGARGHGLEVLEVLLKSGYSKNDILFFDEDPKRKEQLRNGVRVITDLDGVKTHFQDSNFFCLGVGNPIFRENLLNLLVQLGGKLKPLVLDTSFISYSSCGQFDGMPFSFIGWETTFGKLVLVNTRAHVHHQCQVGEFSEIGPAAILLGNCQVGKKCRIGAGAVVLPGVEIGDQVVVGAGAVVTKDFPDNQILVRIPAAPLPKTRIMIVGF